MWPLLLAGGAGYLLSNTGQAAATPVNVTYSGDVDADQGGSFPWMPVLIGAAAVGTVGFFMMRRR
jgi:hypothetical protein